MSAGPARYLLKIAYNGRRYCGWQFNTGTRTVAGALQDAVSKFIGHGSLEKPGIVGSSRTDSGVHALANTCHIDLTRKNKHGTILEPHKAAVVLDAVNFYLHRHKEDIEIVAAQRVAPDFHARFDAKGRTYRYHIVDSPTVQLPSAHDDALKGLSSRRSGLFDNQFSWFLPSDHLDVPSMQLALQTLIGKHDFTSFRSSGCTAASPIKEMTAANIDVIEDGGITPGYRRLCVTLEANSFLYHQVRNIVGALVARVGMGKWSVEQFQEFTVARSRNMIGELGAPQMAPATALFLDTVHYDFEDPKLQFCEQ